MNSKHVLVVIAAIAMALLGAVSASAQVGELRGSVKMAGSDGKSVPVVGAVIDVYRIDITGDYHTKSDKKGEWVFAGLPYVGEYVLAISAPGAAYYVGTQVKAGRETLVDTVLQTGDGKRLSKDEVLARAKTGGGSGGGGAGGGNNNAPSAADKAKVDDMKKKNAAISEGNKKIEDANKVVADTFKAGAAALMANNYDEAIKQSDAGIAADPEQAALWTLKANALKARGVTRYNAAVMNKDDAARASGVEAAKGDFRDAAEAATKSVEIAKHETPATDPAEQARQAGRKYVALSVRAEAMRLFVTKADPTQADAGIAAFQEYIAAEPDATKKLKAQFDLAHMLLDAGAVDKSFVEFKKILADKPDDPDANLGAGLALYGTGDKVKYQEAANYLQHFVDNAPDTNKDKADIKAVLAELKNTENVVPEKTPPRRRRP